MLTYEHLMSAPGRRYIARGDTYRHREAIRHWGWHWSDAHEAWVEDSGSGDDDACIWAVRKLKGVTVTTEPI